MPHRPTRADIAGKQFSTLDTGAMLALRSSAKDLSTILKFGRNPAVGTSEEDVWLVGGDETLMTTAATVYASCTDNTNGVGQVLLVEGLDANWEQQEGHVTLTGQTQAAITKVDGSAATWLRIHRAYQISATPDPVGDVYLAELDGTIVAGVPQDGTKIHGFIDFTDAAQQTEKGMYTIPAGYIGLIYGYQAYMNAPTTGSARYAQVAIEIAELADGADVSNPSWAPRRRIIEAVVGTANVDVEHMLPHPLVVDELTNVHLRALASATSDISASFEMIIVPKET
jgi:hypothetical protein